MNDEAQEEQSQGITLGDIYFVLFRWKWTIIFFPVLAVLVAATLLFVVKKPLYRSEAQLYIRYVIKDKSPNPLENDPNARTLYEGEGSIINTEVQILKSLDLAQQVATAIGPEKILAKAGGGADINAAAYLVEKNLNAEPSGRGSVIYVDFQHPDPALAQIVLQEVIVAYGKKHKEMHLNLAIGDFLTVETDRRRSELAQTEQRLREAKIKAGVTTSVDDAKRMYTEQIAKNREEHDKAEVELAQHQATLDEVAKLAPAVLGTTNAEPEPPREKISDYKRVCARLEDLSKREEILLISYTEDSPLVKEVRQQLADIEKRKKELENDFPKLATPVALPPRVTGPPAGTSIDTSAETIQIRAIKSKIEMLNSQFNEIKLKADKVDELEATIQELEQQRELQDANVKLFTTSLEQSRIGGAVGDGKAPNIGVIQRPTPPFKSWSKTYQKKVTMVTAACASTGLVLAFLIELLLDRSVKRPSDVETKLRLPLFISIPNLGRNGGRRLKATGKDPLLLTNTKGNAAGTASSEETGTMQMAARHRSDPLRRYYEGLRDRLIINFEVRNLTQKPKLVAVTSCGKGVGVTTIAAGLAASLSETGGGNVLLVDLNAEQGASQQFYKGKSGCRLDDALATETMRSALVQTNLCVATERPDEDQLPRVLPGRLANLMPNLQASDYDYIIFDMPPVSQTSMTPRLARLMDMVLLVIESEKTKQDVVKRATALLAESKVNVSAVLNKTRKYVPSLLHHEFLDDI